MPLTEAAIAERVMEDLRWALPGAAIEDPVEVRAVKEKRATFAAGPGVDRIRPAARPPATGGIRNLHLAGDWCRTGWPATMEGAVRSGYAAAAAVLGRTGDDLVGDLPTARLPALLGLAK